VSHDAVEAGIMIVAAMVLLAVGVVMAFFPRLLRVTRNIMPPPAVRELHPIV
jgi:hypothetical protein